MDIAAKTISSILLRV